MEAVTFLCNLQIVWASFTQKANKQDHWNFSCWRYLIKPDWQVFAGNPSCRVEAPPPNSMFTPPSLVTHESTAVLWAREGTHDSANAHF